MLKRTLYNLLVLALLLATFTGCSSTASTKSEQPAPKPSETQPPPETPPLKPEVQLVTLAMSEKPRITTVSATAQDLQELANGNLAFASALYVALRTKEGNLFFSPYSISQALVMTYAGARGETESQMAKTLHFTLPQNRLHPAFNDLGIQLAQRGKGAEGKDGEGFRLNIVNATWGQQGYSFLPQYLDTLAQYYGAGMRQLDFIKAPEPSRITINDWVSEQTEGRIKDLLPSGSINELTRLVLTNAIYFNAAWKNPFKEEATNTDKFYLLDGSSIDVAMMKQNESFGYANGSNYQAVELPYSGEELSMVIVMPKEGEFTSFEQTLDTQLLSSIQSRLESRQVALCIPKFEFDSSLSLRDVLATMGMPVAFSYEADFSRMNGNRDLYISEVLHKAFVSVDEAGTEAAAATAVIMTLKGISEEPIEVAVNRPFIFLIRDIQTNTVLFLGRVVNPSR